MLIDLLDGEAATKELPLILGEFPAGSEGVRGQLEMDGGQCRAVDRPEGQLEALLEGLECRAGVARAHIVGSDSAKL